MCPHVAFRRPISNLSSVEGVLDKLRFLPVGLFGPMQSSFWSDFSPDHVKNVKDRLGISRAGHCMNHC